MTTAVTTAEAWVLPASVPIDERCLTPMEVAHAGAMRAARAAAGHRRARTLLRHAVGRRTGLPPDAVPLLASDRGPPAVALDGGPSVSIAHCGTTAAVVLRDAGPVGIDVEVVGARRRPVPATVLTEERLAVAAALVDHPLAPLAVWVLLEASLKAAGTGFGQRQRTVRFSRAAGGARLDLPDAGVHGCRLHLVDGTVLLAVSTPRDVPDVRWRAVASAGGGLEVATG